MKHQNIEKRLKKLENAKAEEKIDISIEFLNADGTVWWSNKPTARKDEKTEADTTRTLAQQKTKRQFRPPPNEVRGLYNPASPKRIQDENSAHHLGCAATNSNSIRDAGYCDQ